MVVWTNNASDDLKRIYDYISCDSQYYARNVKNEFFKKIKNLDFFPNMGRIVPELKNNKIREIFIYSYRVIYEIKEKEIIILTIIHFKQNIKN